MISTQTRPGTMAQELVAFAPSSESDLRQNVGAFAKTLTARAASLEAHHTNSHGGIKLHQFWNAVGKQQQFRAVARQLRWLLKSCNTHDELAWALGRYLSRLEKWAGDAQMDARVPKARKKRPVEALVPCWRAQGIAAVLPDICLCLEAMLDCA